ncbi:MarR family winged helix-turn-helix transcriptional regulator [Kitasatospora arboriphila]
MLNAHGETTITGLAETIAMDRTTLASNLKPLAREGLVTVEASPTDRRARIAAITDDGRARLATAVPLWQEVQSKFEAAFGAGEAAALRTSLDAVLGTGFEPWAE